VLLNGEKRPHPRPRSVPSLSRSCSIYHA